MDTDLDNSKSAEAPHGAQTSSSTQPQPDPVKSAHEVASAIRKWAVNCNLCSALPHGAEDLLLASVPPAVFSDEQEAYIRSRGVTSIAFNNAEGKVCIYTKRRVTKSKLNALPNFIDGCAIEYPQGHVDELVEGPIQAQAASYIIYANPAGGRFYSCGSSVSPGNAPSAGTMGALVRDQAGAIFGLSNNHVTGSCSHSPPNLPILAPGVADVAPNGLNPFTIGLHHKSLAMEAGAAGNVDIFANKDAAVFRIVNVDSVTSMQRDVYDTPNIVETPSVGMSVEKVGRTTGHTKGKIVGQELMPVLVGVDAPTYQFRAFIYFSNVFVVHGDGDYFSDNGDSGALVVCRKPDGAISAIGMIFAGGPDSGAPGNKKSLVLPLQPILDDLGVTLVHGHNV